MVINNDEIMKKVLLFALVGLLSLSFFSCEKDDDFTIVGSWNVDKFTVYVNDDTSVDVTDAGTLIFNSDKSGSFELENGEGDFTWSQISGSVTIIGSELSGNYSIVDNSDNNVILERTVQETLTRYEMSRIN